MGEGTLSKIVLLTARSVTWVERAVLDGMEEIVID